MSPVAKQLLSSARTGEGKDEHNTPPEILDRVRRIGPIMFDPCPGAGDVVNPSYQHNRESDGLGIDWISASADGFGVCWVNWPYSRSTQWAFKCAIEAQRGVSIIALTAARPDTKWWRAMWNASDAVGFWRGRITFLGSKHPAPFPSALFALNVSQRRFRSAFGDVCEIVCPS